MFDAVARFESERVVLVASCHHSRRPHLSRKLLQAVLVNKTATNKYLGIAGSLQNLAQTKGGMDLSITDKLEGI